MLYSFICPAGTALFLIFTISHQNAFIKESNYLVNRHLIVLACQLAPGSLET